MPLSDFSKNAGELELEILRALCSRTISPADWLQAMARLAKRPWKEPEHKVVFGALQALRTTDAQVRREQLPAQATRMGFPDVDWRNYLTGDATARERLDQLVDSLERIEAS